jgi:hypothetical protein
LAAEEQAGEAVCDGEQNQQWVQRRHDHHKSRCGDCGYQQVVLIVSVRALLAACVALQWVAASLM